MKKLFFFLLIIFLLVTPAFAANEYYQMGFSYGVNENLVAPSLGIHAQYQFGASFTENFDFGFGTFADLDFALSNKAGKDVGFSLLFGPSFVVKETPFITTSLVIGPQLDIYDDADTELDDENGTGLGFGASLSYTFIPAAEQNARVQLGFTVGAIGSAMWNTDSEAFTPSVKGFFGITLKGPLMFIPDYDLYDEILWYGVNM